MRRKSLGFAVALALVVAACGEGEAGNRSDDEPLIQVRSEGGFAPVEFILGNGPEYTVLNNRQLISRGPSPGIFPGPLVVGYQVRELTDEEFESVEDLVDEIGLPDMVDEFDDSAAGFVADATTEVITYWDENGVHRYSVYALGIGSDPLNPQEPSDPRTVAFGDLFERLGEMATSGTPYDPERVRIIAGVSQFGADPEFADVREWPLAGEDPSTWQRVNQDWQCKVFGPEVLDVFQEASQATTWLLLGGTEYKLLVRPLLPGEPNCPV